VLEGVTDTISVRFDVSENGVEGVPFHGNANRFHGVPRRAGSTRRLYLGERQPARVVLDGWHLLHEVDILGTVT